VINTCAYVGKINMVDKSGDALDALFVQEAEISNEVLRDLLVKYVQFSPEGKIFTKAEFTRLPNKQKILVILLSKKVLKLKISLEEETTGLDVINSTGLTRGSVYPALRELQEKDRLVTSKDGKYWIPNYAINNIRQMFGI
jgi:hypothetical protein